MKTSIVNFVRVLNSLAWFAKPASVAEPYVSAAVTKMKDAKVYT